jgi:hypothetical protein
MRRRNVVPRVGFSTSFKKNLDALQEKSCNTGLPFVPAKSFQAHKSFISLTNHHITANGTGRALWDCVR